MFCENEHLTTKNKKNMKVVIFGATGGIGKWAMKYALESNEYLHSMPIIGS